MAEQDIALMREIVKWRRANEVSFFLYRRGKGFGGAHGFAQWDRAGSRWRRRCGVAFERETPDTLTLTVDYHKRDWQRVEVASFRQAVDILAAVELLPARFSSAYAKGWGARSTATDADGCLDLTTRPELVPAVEPTW